MAATLVNAGQGLAPGGPGSSAKATCAAGAASAATQFRAVATAGGFVIGNEPVQIAVKCAESAAGPGIHIAFGDSVSLAAPTAADHVIGQADGQVLWTVPSNITHFRIFGEGTSAGSVYVYVT